MTTPDPAALARRLSPAQAKALLWLPARGSHWTAGWSRLSAGTPGAPDSKKFRRLRDRGLCESCASNQRHRITPLGLAVRAELVRREAGNGG